MASVPLNIDDSGCSLEISVDETPASSCRARGARAGGKQNEAALFCSEFLSVDIDQIVSDLNEKGYYAFPSAISQDTLKTIERDATQSRIGLNENSISGVYSEKQYYLTNLLAVSKTFYNFATSSFVFKICERYLGNEFRLKALRYYETYGGHHMQWHTDNKTDKAFAHIPGIIFIFMCRTSRMANFNISKALTFGRAKRHIATIPTSSSKRTTSPRSEASRCQVAPC
ncbi:hypothetical protein [Paraburkholderia sp. 40]|uniref:hypothetical protein n=1 Tax=Paraburkholderia sp. 40 TaxID=2991059 RepID=UPI003D2487E5